LTGSLQVLVDGNITDHSSLENSSREIGSITLLLEENNGISATFPSGISLTVSSVKKMMAINLALPEEFKSKTKGLFGVWNDDPNDDFILPDGSNIPISSNDSTIHYHFGLKCKLYNSCYHKLEFSLKLKCFRAEIKQQYRVRCKTLNLQSRT